MDASAKPLIELNSIKKVFLTEEVETHALERVDLAIQAGEYVSISGPSGCGKTTLLSILGLLDVATDGEYALDGDSVTRLTSEERARVRNRCAGENEPHSPPWPAGLRNSLLQRRCL